VTGPLPEELASASYSDLLRLSADAKSRIDEAYWTFTRQARGVPPPGHLYSRAAWVNEALSRVERARRVR
jgi:hypothetical protein